MKLLVTGATGFIGSHFIRKACQLGHEVHGVSRFAEGPTLHRCDDVGSELLAIMQMVNPDVVVHLASLFIAEHKPADVEQLLRTNIEFGVNLAEAMTQCGVGRMVNTGTSWQHYGTEDYNPVCLYAATKQAFEDILRFYVEATHLQVITLKLFDTYGPYDTRPKLMSLFRRISRSGENLGMSPGEQLIDLVYVDDVVEAFLLACNLTADCPGMQEFAVSSGHSLSLKDLAKTYAAATGRDLHIEWGVRPYRKREVMTPWKGGKPLPGWTPKIGLEEGIQRMEAADV